MVRGTRIEGMGRRRRKRRERGARGKEDDAPLTGLSNIVVPTAHARRRDPRRQMHAPPPSIHPAEVSRDL